MYREKFSLKLIALCENPGDFFVKEITHYFQELKKQGHKLANFKPTPDHWAAFTKAVIKLRVFDEFFQLGFQQALLQFANCLPFMSVDDSSQSAKENAVFNLLYINMLRMVFAQMIESTDQPILSLEFFNKLAKIEDDEQMIEFVKNEFVPIVRSPMTLGLRMPKFKSSYDAMSNLMKFLYAKVNKI